MLGFNTLGLTLLNEQSNEEKINRIGQMIFGNKQKNF